VDWKKKKFEGKTEGVVGEKARLCCLRTPKCQNWQDDASQVGDATSRGPFRARLHFLEAELWTALGLSWSMVPVQPGLQVDAV